MLCLVLLGASACGSSAAGPEPATKAEQRDPGDVVSVEIRQDYVDPECRMVGAASATVTVGPDQLLVVDAGSDGTVDGFRDGESLVVRWPDAEADDDRWVSVPVDPAAPETQYIQGLGPGREVPWLFLEGRTLLDESQRLADSGERSPQQVPGDSTLSWESDGGAVLEARLEVHGATSGFARTVDVRRVTPPVLDQGLPREGVQPLLDEPASAVVPRSLRFVASCTNYTPEVLEDIEDCVTSAAAGFSVGEWIQQVGVTAALLDGGLCTG